MNTPATPEQMIVLLQASIVAAQVKRVVDQLLGGKS